MKTIYNLTGTRNPIKITFLAAYLLLIVFSLANVIVNSLIQVL